MVFTLAQHAQAQREPLKKGVYLGIVRESVMADILPFRSVSSLSETGVRYDEVIEPDYIPISGDIAEKTVSAKQLSWGVYEMAVHIDIPIPLEKEGGLVEKPSTRQTKMAILGSAYKFNDTFVNGDQASDPNAFDGIEKLVGNLDSDQTIGSSEIDITGAVASADAHALIDRVDEGIDAIEGHKPTFALCSRKFGLRFRSVLRQEGLLGDHYDWVRNGFPFGDIRQKLSTKSTDPMFLYAGIPFYDAGPKSDQVSSVIADDNAEGGSTGATRVYMVKLGPDDIEGLQYSPPNMRRIGVLEDKEVERHRFIWDHGLAMWGHRSLVKVQGIKVV